MGGAGLHPHTLPVAAPLPPTLTPAPTPPLHDCLRPNGPQTERVLFHYNGHGVPRPTANGEVWVFNKSYTQYIPLSLYDLQVLPRKGGGGGSALGCGAGTRTCRARHTRWAYNARNHALAHPHADLGGHARHLRVRLLSCGPDPAQLQGEGGGSAFEVLGARHACSVFHRQRVDRLPLHAPPPPRP